MDFDIEEAQVARAMIEQAESVTILADSSKIGRIASFEVCSLERITNLVCDQTLTPSYLDALIEAGVNVYTAK